MKKHIYVVSAVIEKDGLYFCAKRPNKGEVSLKWEFPGGKIEPGETSEEALKREIYEELKSNIQIIELITTINYEYNTFFLTMYVYKCNLIDGQLQISEHVDSCWISRNDLKTLDWAPADIEVLDYLINMK